MKKLTILFFLVSTLSFSQEKVTKNLGDFHQLKIYRGLSVKLIKTDAPKIIIEGKKSEQVTVKNINGILKISLKVLESFYADDISISLYFVDDIELIDANEGSTITSDRILKQDKIILKASEAGKINLEVGTTDIEVRAVSGGIITLEGYSENQKVHTNTGGNYKGENFKTKTTIISTSSGASATINATKFVNANANLGGTITITGDPTEVLKKESLGGYVRH